MAYTVTITYTGPVVDAGVREGYPISRIMLPTGSYIDSPVYEIGHPVTGDNVAENYGKSIYATNVAGLGVVPLPAYWAETLIPLGIPLAQFHLSVVKDGLNEKEQPYVTFDVDDFKEAFYFQEIGAQIIDQGFTVEVTKN